MPHKSTSSTKFTLQVNLTEGDSSISSTDGRSQSQQKDEYHENNRFKKQQLNLQMDGQTETEDGENHFAIDFELQSGHRLRMLCALTLTNNPQMADDQPGDHQNPHALIRSVHVDSDTHNHPLSPQQIYHFVERALHHFHSTLHLSRNPLTDLIDFAASLPTGAAGAVNPGIALRQLLDQAVTMISGVQAHQKLGCSQWCLDHYLHLRYRQGMQHKDLASHLGYTERHLHRLRRELVLEAAELIVEHCR